jgi:hypothetical protein
MTMTKTLPYHWQAFKHSLVGEARSLPIEWSNLCVDKVLPYSQILNSHAIDKDTALSLASF